MTDIHGDDSYYVLQGAEAALPPLLHPSRTDMYMSYELYRRHLAEVFSRK